MSNIWKIKINIILITLLSTSISLAQEYDRNEGFCAEEEYKFNTSTVTQEKLKLIISGSNTLGRKLMPYLLRGYAKEKKLESELRRESPINATYCFKSQESATQNFEIILQATDSVKAFEMLKKNTAIMGMSSRPINKIERDSFEQNGLEIHEDTIALDGLVVITNKKNPINELSFQQIADVFSGKTTHWRDIGWDKGGKINVYTRNKESGLSDLFKLFFLKPAKLKLSINAEKLKSNKDISEAVGRDELSIGFTGFSSVRGAKVLSLLDDSCKISYSPSKFSIKTEEYPLSYHLFLYTMGIHKRELADDIIDYIRLDSAKKIIDKFGFVNSNIFLDKNNKKNRINTYLGRKVKDRELLLSLKNKTDNASRVSINFQFKLGTNKPENGSILKQDIKRLKDYLKEKDYSSSQIMLLGFTSETGDYSKNKQLSKNRAIAISKELMARGVMVETENIIGYSDLVPVSCGLEKNRRVEVWIKNSTPELKECD